MSTSYTVKALGLGIFLLATFSVSTGYAQGGQTNQNASGRDGSYIVGGFLGFTDRRDKDLTLGGEFEYLARDMWSYGAILEYTPDGFRDEDVTLLLATANFRPNPAGRLKLTGGAGVEFKDYGGDDFRFRLGVAYDLFLEGALTLAPRIAFDFGEGDDSVVFGATISRKF